jgi:hypothetical protein
MTKNIAVLDNNNIVLNILICSDEEIETTSRIKYEDNQTVYIGGDYVDGFFYSPSPFPSWIRFEGNWIAPKPKPSKGQWFWNEDLSEWHET